MHTPEFRRHFVEFVHVQTLMTPRSTTKGWKAAAEEVIDEGVRSGELLVHDGRDISWNLAEARRERRKLVTRAIFFLNVTKVGDYACSPAVNLVVVDIPDGIVSISRAAFGRCRSLTTVSFPTTFTSIGGWAFDGCNSLENVDLLHTNLEELGLHAFIRCPELKSMTIPDSLLTIGYEVFQNCSKLAPSNISVNDSNAVVAHLRSQQLAQN
ncbi:hypothetical protein TrLO_g10370 [Triparma laevis f. longispina]|uniref:Uncharacterized protein n=1 Tax=Triparma laevis f. longispina TaxID=1714387 RepID=A0A9W7DQM7_9STRA|nr:hypothetical protein TrLO_g10370 [Triparma laevis f. longispina]